MKGFIVLALGLFVACALFRPINAVASSTPTFASIPWGSSDQRVKETLAAKGFTFDKRDSDGDLDFKGEINGKHVAIFEYLTQSRKLVRTQVVFLTDDDEAISYFQDVADTLTGKYGPPSKHFAFYEDPYTDSDSEMDHETAFKVGKGTLASFWFFDTGGAVDIEVTKQLNVSISYESPGWVNELNRRKSEGNSVL